MGNPLPEARFERYELHNELGRGGMAVVYAAFDRARQTMVALKCLSSERFSVGKARDRAVTMFEREYYALSQLTHPRIIQVYDYGLDGEGPYYTMECLTGESLRTQAPRHWAQVCALGRDIPSALALLHSRSLIHRDVTPLNIHCTADARAKLIDFGAIMPAGLARHLVGTPAFIAPEAMQQQSLDGRADRLHSALAYISRSAAATPIPRAAWTHCTMFGRRRRSACPRWRARYPRRWKS